MPSIYLIPGYLSEKEGLPYGPHLLGDGDQLGILGDFGRGLAKLVDDPVYMIHWPTGRGFLELLEQGISKVELARRAVRFYRRLVLNLAKALKAADRTAQEIGQMIRESGEPAIVIGQSLGARVALKVREHAPARVIAIAPPLSYEQVDWERFRASKEPAECYFSRHDWMIGLFGAATLPPWGTNLGVHGVPPHLVDALRPIDVSRLDNGRPRGHGDYVWDWIDLLRIHSTILKPREEPPTPEAAEKAPAKKA